MARGGKCLAFCTGFLPQHLSEFSEEERVVHPMGVLVF